MNPIDSVSNIATHNLQTISNNAPVQTDVTVSDHFVTGSTSFSSYVEQALAQIGVANPSYNHAAVIHSANRMNLSEKSMSTFIQNLFTILGKEDAAKHVKFMETHASQTALQKHLYDEVMTAYNPENSTTVGNVVNNLKTLLQHLHENSSNNDMSTMTQSLQDNFQSIFGGNNKATLSDFLQTLTQNLQGQNPLGIIINTQA